MKEQEADPLDHATSMESFSKDKNIKYISSKANTLEVEATGYCLFCGEDFDGSLVKRFCDFNCMTDYSRLKLRK